MPEDTIRAYVKDTASLKEHNIFIAFRGMLGNPPKIKETSSYIKKILQKDAGCQGKCKRYKVRFAVDPILFENYKVTEVPTFVYDRQVQNRDVGRKKEIKNESEYYKLKGDVSLEYALEIFRRETKEKELEILLDKIKPEYGTSN
jgi:type-F conjugative transfer system pilin assembly protein TrbC